MYELEYVRKRKRRIIAAIVGGVSTVVVSSLAIVAFLGRFVGTFTVSLETRNVELTLSEKSDFVNRTSFLRVNDLAPFHEFTYSSFERYGGDEVIDSEQTSYDLGFTPGSEDGSGASMNFFKYTFFIKNVSVHPARYNLSVNILESVNSDDGRSLESTMRVMIYDNGSKTVYAKRASTPHIDEEGKADYRAPVSISEYDATEEFKFQGYAEMFDSSQVVTTFSDQPIDVDEVRRYTIVTWLEGFQSSNTELAPKGATIKLGVEINAYEN